MGARERGVDVAGAKPCLVDDVVTQLRVDERRAATAASGSRTAGSGS